MNLFKKIDYIEEYNNTLSKTECNRIISYFESQPQILGITYRGYDVNKKKCLQLLDTKFSDNTAVSNILFSKLWNCLKKYNEKYQELSLAYWWKVQDEYTIQKYSKEDDGFKIWHCEHGTGSASSRILAWMFYLNSAKSGTEFFRYPTIKPKMGKCVIWPSSWTHMHKGVTPNDGLKYIVTGWVSYNMEFEI